MDAPDELLAAAVDITRAASGPAAQRFLEGVPVSTKADDTEVTPADVEVEEPPVTRAPAPVSVGAVLTVDAKSGR